MRDKPRFKNIKLPLKEEDKRIRHGVTYLIYLEDSVYDDWVTVIADKEMQWFDHSCCPIRFDNEDVKKVYQIIK